MLVDLWNGLMCEVYSNFARDEVDIQEKDQSRNGIFHHLSTPPCLFSSIKTLSAMKP